MTRTLFTLIAVAGVCTLPARRGLRADDKPPGPERWETAIQSFEKQDRDAPPAKGGIVFVGSSSIRLWDLAKSFPQEKPLNRGFGGSEVADSVHFAERIVLPYEPRTIVMYAGDNDIAGGKSPCDVHADFQKFVNIVHSKLPQTRIVYISIKPSIKRWSLIHKIRAANALISATCVEDERLTFVDVGPSMLGADGMPRPELFISDGLHLSDAGYQIWNDLVRPLLH